MVWAVLAVSEHGPLTVVEGFQLKDADFIIFILSLYSLYSLYLYYIYYLYHIIYYQTRV